jgi:hypothetical protein
MSPTRPVFSDGAILGAADLTALAQLDRDRDARASRHLHTPGIGAGLGLETEERVLGTTPYVEVTLRPGWAIDGSGREVVVAAAMPVSVDRFTGDNPDAPTGWYPVFVHGLDTPVAATNGQSGCQGGGGPTRIAEDVDIEFGRTGDAGVEQPAPTPDAGPGDGSWRVLVGFVSFDTTIDRFVAVATEADRIRVAPAGVRAGLVAGQMGRVEVRPRPELLAGLPAVVVDEAKGGSLIFGLHTGTGAVKELMSVDGGGNLTVAGTISGEQTAGTVYVVSGSAFDGTVLPLPAGVTQAALDSDTRDVAVIVTPRVPLPSGNKRFVSGECRVDEERRLHCWGSTFEPGGQFEDAPSACDFIVLVSVRQEGT